MGEVLEKLDEVPLGNLLAADEQLRFVSSIIESEINNIGLPKEYIQKLKELYKISLILKSGDCSDYDSYSMLFAKKYIEICQQGDEIINQVINASPEQMQEYTTIFENAVDDIIDRRTSITEEETRGWEQAKLYFHSGDPDVIKRMIAGSISFNTKRLIRDNSLLEWEEQLSEEQLQEVMDLDVDSELQRIMSFGVDRIDYPSDYNSHLSSCYKIIDKIGYDSYTLSYFHQPINDVAFNLNQNLYKKGTETTGFHK